ncbi:5-bromo-4-chloroindolyl phosphate hydrolysis family protein [Bacillus sp. MUM 13]|uniref:5-bromo-4-chloroindolyl phosphate hydrolysis family protein n=1 Tax=Bacillus sp. MUM 13 TaxID=1678001 RepID=UPI0008F58E2C|nr:5-bromo-4-chloroindolyl phosphate hydrolysis family protein [Bacillus sp. MUM 13]OIK14663.1 protein xpaC [Bacillus sp. MUM 13]
MNPFFTVVLQLFFAIPAAVVVWLGSYFAINQTFLLSSAYALGAGALVYLFVSLYLKIRFLRKHGLSRKEYQYIKGNLDEAKAKIHRLHKSLLSIRQLSFLKERLELVRITRKIYHLTRKEPKRFYLAEHFYFSHLDSAVELTEKYILLSSQPRKSKEITQTLQDTRSMLAELNATIEEDLFQTLSNDIDQLHYELDVARHSMKAMRES